MTPWENKCIFPSWVNWVTGNFQNTLLYTLVYQSGIADLPQVRDMEGGGAVDSLSPGLVAWIPHQPGVELKAWWPKPVLGCRYDLQEEEGQGEIQFISSSVPTASVIVWCQASLGTLSFFFCCVLAAHLTDYQIGTEAFPPYLRFLFLKLC